MSNRLAKRMAFGLAVFFLFVFAVPIFIYGAIVRSEIISVLAILIGASSLAAIVPLWVSSNALTAPYGLFGNATLNDISKSLRYNQWIVTSGRIGDHYWARGWLPISCSKDGLAISLISGDIVFVSRSQIQSIAAIGRNQAEIAHSDAQVHAPIIVGRRGYCALKQWLPDLIRESSP